MVIRSIRSEIRCVTENLKTALGKQVRHFRVNAGMSQETLAAEIGRTAETISNLERGRSFPTLQTLALIARTLDMPMREFFNFDQGDEVSDQERYDLITRLQIARIDLPVDHLKIAVAQIEALASTSK